MRLIRTGTALIMAATVGAVALLPVAAQAQASCKWYGATALKQQQRNEQLKCGFKGDAWHSDLGAHMGWCASVPPSVWKAAAQERDKQLSQCAKR